MQATKIILILTKQSKTFGKKLVKPKNENDTKEIGTIRVDYYKDLNKLHLKYAKANGIKGFKSNKEFNENIKEYIADDELVKIETCDYYVVDKLTH